MKRYIFILLAICAFVCSCENDESWAKDYLMDFMDIHTDSQGKSVLAINDKDEKLIISNPQKDLAADSTYRYVVEYTRDDDSRITLYNAWPAISEIPIELEEGGTIYKDEVIMKSMWQTNRYINAELDVPTSSMKHTMRFIDLGITDNGKGQQIGRIQLSHNMNRNKPSYTGKAYLSVPMKFYADKLTPETDSVYIILPTANGETTYTFLYKYKDN